LLIAIDGPAGAGKSTVAKALARELRFAYLDTGAMYRCVALLSLRFPGQESTELARSAKIELFRTPAGEPGPVFLDGEDVSDAIRAPEVSEQASVVASDPGVREALVAKQRQTIATGNWVAEGRDIGTVVAPNAQLKIFLTADASERARRRASELGVDPATVLAEQTLRDERDSTRAHSPLAPAPGSITLDSSGLRIDEVVGRIAALVSQAA
jgi:cytidylate kinase